MSFDSPEVTFFIRTIAFLLFFLIGAYFLFKHIEKIKKEKGVPDQTKNAFDILKHYFTKH